MNEYKINVIYNNEIDVNDIFIKVLNKNHPVYAGWFFCNYVLYLCMICYNIYPEAVFIPE